MTDYELLGKIKEIYVREDFDWKNIRRTSKEPTGYRYIIFPSECILIVEYELGTLEWVAFNVDPTQIRDIIEDWPSIQVDPATNEKVLHGNSFRLSAFQAR